MFPCTHQQTQHLSMVHPLPEINHQQLVQQHAKRRKQKRMNTAIEDEQKSIVICYLSWVTIKQDENINCLKLSTTKLLQK